MKQFISELKKLENVKSGIIEVKCPSNIALIKYWGKKDVQIPMNPSLSYTLTNSYTESKINYTPKDSKGFIVNVILDGQLNEQFAPRIYTFFDRISEYVPFLDTYEFEIHTHNTFPHSSGIASSASSMGALALGLVELEEKLGAKFSKEEKLRKASFLARLGSGSACRSIFPGLTVWGETGEVIGSSDLYAIPYPYEVHENFKNLQDTILLIDEGQKEVSSSVGHKLMENHPYAEKRFISAEENLKKLIPILQSGDLKAFGEVVEHEALSLHALMMTSSPAYILMKPNTLSAIQRVWTFRKKTTANIFFTLDAGANVHLLYPKNESDTCMNFIQNELLDLCSGKKNINDYLF